MVSHPETGSDSPIGSDRDRGRDIMGLPNCFIFVNDYGLAPKLKPFPQLNELIKMF